MNSSLPILLLGWSLSAALVLAVAVMLARRWSVGRREAFALGKALRRAPRAYLHDIHEVVIRERGAGPMHAAVALSVVTSVPLLGVATIAPSVVTGYLLIACSAGLLAGGIQVARRRYPHRPTRLSGGMYQRLPGIIGLYGATTCLLGISLTWAPSALDVTAPLAAVACIGLALQFVLGPLRHVLAGSANLIAHPRPERLGAPLASGAIRPADLGAPSAGVARIEEFSWRRLVNFDACVQCGRCEAACPANAAGLPLNPKALVRQFAAALPHAPDYWGSGHPTPLAPTDGQRVIRLSAEPAAWLDPQTVWACTTCRACVYECPMLVEHVDAIVDLRRHQTLELGATPGKAPQALAQLRLADNAGGYPPQERIEWTTDLGLRVIEAGKPVDVLLWLGEGGFQLRHQRTLRSLVRILRKGGVEFAVLGETELDTGDLARRLGDESTFQALARRNVELLRQFSFRRIVTADPHVLHSLRNEYPAFGGHYDVVHHTTLLAELITSGKIIPTKRLPDAVTYHDPCYLARYNGEISSPRVVLDRIVSSRLEMARSGMRTSCCGGGGGAPLTDVPAKIRIPDLRMAQVRETGATTVAVACPNCAVMLEGVTGPRPAVADIAELLDACL